MANDEDIVAAASRVLPIANVTAWLDTPLLWFDGKSPRALMRTESGKKIALDYLHQVEHGVYT